MLHPLLQRQLQRLDIDVEGASSQWMALLDRVSQAYAEADQERYRLERSIQICSEEMSELNASLAAERDQLRAIFECAAVGIVRASFEGRIYDCNAAYCEMLGRSKADIIGHRWSEWVHEDDGDVSKLPGPHERPMAIDRKYKHANGSTVWASVGISTVKEANGKPAFNIAIVDDRTQEKHLEVSLRHAQKLEAVGRLAAGIAHEINTPIQFVGDNLTFLQSAISNAFAAARRAIEMVPAERAADVAALIEGHDIDYLEKQAPEAIQQSLGGIEHIGNIVQAMKFMSHDQRPDDFTGIDLNTTLRNIVMVATPETKYVASVTLDLGDIAPIAGSATDLNQVFLNLIVNAAHAVGDVMERTGVRGSIDVKTWMEGDEVIVAVSDTGTGIPHGVRDKIFDPFFTTKPVGRGTGQGLSIARAIVRKHHGTLTFETEVGVGTTFRVRLPCHPARRDAA